ncbi:hypothetical protein AB0K49_04340 [Streptomyces decoyicus]|uniref:hypothetical protein n=1 Tax=Streptomyces decoyicus TaxID=249567 RepID=UPI00345D42CF
MRYERQPLTGHAAVHAATRTNYAVSASRWYKTWSRGGDTDEGLDAGELHTAQTTSCRPLGPITFRHWCEQVFPPAVPG